MRPSYTVWSPLFFSCSHTRAPPLLLPDVYLELALFPLPLFLSRFLSRSACCVERFLPLPVTGSARAHASFSPAAYYVCPRIARPRPTATNVGKVPHSLVHRHLRFCFSKKKQNKKKTKKIFLYL